jgi:hypothetical protein
MTRILRLLAVLPILALTLSCHIEEPFARDNHWDVDGDAKKTLTGTDSTFSIGDRISVSLVTDPALPPGVTSIEWVGLLDTAVQVLPAGNAEFVVNRAHAEFQAVAVSAQFDDVIVAWTVVVGQRLASFDLLCGSVAAPVACDATPLGVNLTRTVNSTMLDANGNGIRRRNAIMARATTVVRDPSILSTVPTTVNAAGAWTVIGVAPGATWLVITADGVRDSVRVVVGP